MTLQDLANFGTAAGALMTGAGLLLAARQMVIAARGNQASLFLEIYREWDRVYPTFLILLTSPIDPKEEEACLAMDFDTFRGTEFWREARDVFAFYEFLGACVRERLIQERVLFSMVTVSVPMWEKYAGLINHFRGERPDLYRSWEDLILRRRRYRPGREHLPLWRSLFP